MIYSPPTALGAAYAPSSLRMMAFLRMRKTRPPAEYHVSREFRFSFFFQIRFERAVAILNTDLSGNVGHGVTLTNNGRQARHVDDAALDLAQVRQGELDTHTRARHAATQDKRKRTKHEHENIR